MTTPKKRRGKKTPAEELHRTPAGRLAAGRPMVSVTIATATVEGLDTLAREDDSSRGKVIDALVAAELARRARKAKREGSP